jgi:hypothetical protein
MKSMVCAINRETLRRHALYPVSYRRKKSWNLGWSLPVHLTAMALYGHRQGKEQLDEHILKLDWGIPLRL